MADDNDGALPQRKVWHSILRGYNPTIKFIGDLNENISKYETQGHPDGHGFRYFVVPDDENYYYYLPETSEIADKIEQIPNQQWVKLNATGGKDEPADIDPVAVEVNESQTSQSGPQRASSGNGPRLGPDSIIEQYELVRNVALKMYEDEITGEDGLIHEAGQRLVTTLFIQWSKTGRRAPLYPGQGEEDEPETEPEPEETGTPLGDDDLPF